MRMLKSASLIALEPTAASNFIISIIKSVALLSGGTLVYATFINSEVSSLARFIFSQHSMLTYICSDTLWSNSSRSAFINSNCKKLAVAE